MWEIEKREIVACDACAATEPSTQRSTRLFDEIRCIALPAIINYTIAGQFDARKIKCQKPVEKCVMRFFGNASEFVHLDRHTRAPNPSWRVSTLDSLLSASLVANRWSRQCVQLKPNDGPSTIRNMKSNSNCVFECCKKNQMCWTDGILSNEPIWPPKQL